MPELVEEAGGSSGGSRGAGEGMPELVAVPGSAEQAQVQAQAQPSGSGSGPSGSGPSGSGSSSGSSSSSSSSASSSSSSAAAAARPPASLGAVPGETAEQASFRAAILASVRGLSASQLMEQIVEEGITGSVGAGREADVEHLITILVRHAIQG